MGSLNSRLPFGKIVDHRGFSPVTARCQSHGFALPFYEFLLQNSVPNRVSPVTYCEPQAAKKDKKFVRIPKRTLRSYRTVASGYYRVFGLFPFAISHFHVSRFRPTLFNFLQAVFFMCQPINFPISCRFFESIMHNSLFRPIFVCVPISPRGLLRDLEGGSTIGPEGLFDSSRGLFSVSCTRHQRTSLSEQKWAYKSSFQIHVIVSTYTQKIETCSITSF